MVRWQGKRPGEGPRLSLTSCRSGVRSSMLIATVPWIVCLVGMVFHLAATNPKVSWLGLVAFGAGLLVALLGLEHVSKSLFP